MVDPEISKAATSASQRVGRYDAFISYSHGASGELARGVKNALQAFAKPWWRRRSMNVFHDETNLAADPSLWDSIAASLDAADWLILIASPQAAASKWVKREVRRWLGEADQLAMPVEALDLPLTAPDPLRAKRMVFVLASGAIVWSDGAEPDFNWTMSTALPKCLAGVFQSEPLWIDLSKIVAAGAKQGDLGVSNAEFHGGIARIYSGIKHIDLADLIGEDARQHRRTMRTAWSAAAALGLLAVAAGIAAWLALLAAAAADKQRQIAEADQEAALAQSLLAQGPANLVEAGRSAIESYRNMLALSHLATAPEWLVGGLEASGLSAIPLLGQIVQANRYAADFDRLRPVVDVIRGVEHLLPESVLRVRNPSGENASFLALLPGDLLVSQNYGNAVQVRRMDDKEEPRTNFIEAPAVRINGVGNASFSPDGRFVALESAGDGLVRITDTATGETVGTIDPRAVFEPEAFDPLPPDTSGGSEVTEVFVAGAQSGEPLLAGLALNANGSHILLITRGGRGALLAAPGGSVLQGPYAVDASRLRGLDRLAEIALDPAAQKVAITSSANEIGSVPVVVLDTRNGQAAYPALVHSAHVGALSFSADGARLATGTDDGWVSVWNAGTGLRERAFAATASVESLAFGRDVSVGLLLAGTGQGFARLYDVDASREVAQLPHPGRMGAVAWSADGRRVATGTVAIGAPSAEPIRVWSVEAMMSVSSARMRTRYSVDRIAAAQGRIAAIEWPSSLHVWDYSSGRPVRDFPGAESARQPFSFASGGRTVTTVAAEEDGLAYVFDVASGERRAVPGPGLTTAAISERESFLGNAAFDREGLLLARVIQGVSTPLCRIEFWDLKKAVRSDQVDCVGRVTGIALDAPGRQAAWIEAGDPSRVVLRDLASRMTRWDLPLSLPLSDYVGRRIGFDDEGERLAVGTRDTILILDAAAGSTETRIGPIGSDIIDLGMNGAGTRVAVCSPDRQVRVFDVASGRVVQRMPFDTDTFGSSGLVFSDDGERLLAAFGDSNAGNPRIWQWYVEPDIMVDRLAKRLGQLAPDWTPAAK